MEEKENFIFLYGGRNFNRGFIEEDDNDNEIYFENIYNINVKINSLSEIVNRRGGWLVLFFYI